LDDNMSNVKRHIIGSALVFIYHYARVRMSEY
jgi:hypothetical protein